MSEMSIWGRNNAVACSVNPPAKLKTFVVRTEGSIETTDLVKDSGSHQKTCGAPRRYELDVPVSSISRLSLQTRFYLLFRLWLRCSGFP